MLETQPGFPLVNVIPHSMPTSMQFSLEKGDAVYIANKLTVYIVRGSHTLSGGSLTLAGCCAVGVLTLLLLLLCCLASSNTCGMHKYRERLTRTVRRLTHPCWLLRCRCADTVAAAAVLSGVLESTGRGTEDCD